MTSEIRELETPRRRTLVALVAVPTNTSVADTPGRSWRRSTRSRARSYLLGDAREFVRAIHDAGVLVFRATRRLTLTIVDAVLG